MSKIRVVKSDSLKIKVDKKKENVHVKKQTPKIKQTINIRLKADINFIKKKEETKTDKHIQLSGTKETTVNKIQHPDGTIQVQRRVRIKRAPKININKQKEFRLEKKQVKVNENFNNKIFIKRQIKKEQASIQNRKIRIERNRKEDVKKIQLLLNYHYSNSKIDNFSKIHEERINLPEIETKTIKLNLVKENIDDDKNLNVENIKKGLKIKKQQLENKENGQKVRIDTKGKLKPAIFLPVQKENKKGHIVENIKSNYNKDHNVKNTKNRIAKVQKIKEDESIKNKVVNSIENVKEKCVSAVRNFNINSLIKPLRWVLCMLLSACIIFSTFPAIFITLISVNTFYVDSSGKSSDEESSTAIQMATKMNKLNDDYWEGLELAVSDRTSLSSMPGYHTDLDIPFYDKVSVKFYDAYGKEIEVSNTSNNKAILSLASMYEQNVNNIKTNVNFQDYCTFLWISSHAFELEENEPYHCDYNNYEIETSSSSTPPALPEGYYFREEIEGGLDVFPGHIWCDHGEWKMTETIRHEHEDGDGDTYYTYTYMWTWICNQHINATMKCNISNLNSPIDDENFDEAKRDERIFDADFIGSNLTNEIIEGYCDEEGYFDVDLWIENFKPKHFDTVVEWLEDSGNNVPDLKEYICSKVRGTYEIKGEEPIEEAKINSYNPFMITVYAKGGYERYVWQGWTMDMIDVVRLRQEDFYAEVTEYDDILNDRLLGTGASISDYTTVVTLINGYKQQGKLSKRQEQIMKLALASVGRIPYYYGGGHPGGGKGQRNEETGYIAEGDEGSLLTKPLQNGVPRPAELMIPAETFGTYVGTDWYKRIKRGLDCSSFIWFLYASADCEFSEIPITTYELLTVGNSTEEPKPCDIYIKSGHVMLYIGNLYEATEGRIQDATPYFIECIGENNATVDGEVKSFKIDNVRIRYGTEQINSREQIEVSGYHYRNMEKYYDVPIQGIL